MTLQPSYRASRVPWKTEGKGEKSKKEKPEKRQRTRRLIILDRLFWFDKKERKWSKVSVLIYFSIHVHSSYHSHDDEIKVRSENNQFCWGWQCVKLFR